MSFYLIIIILLSLFFFSSPFGGLFLYGVFTPLQIVHMV